MTVTDTRTATATVLVIDDQELVASSLAYALAGKGFDAHRVPITDLATVRETVSGFRPGVVLLDLDLGTGPDGRRLDGVELITPLRRQGWSVLVVTGTADLDRVAAAVAAGATSWVVKGANFQELVNSTVEVATGRGGLSESERSELLARHHESAATKARAAERLGRLTEREREVLDRLTAGASPASIAEETYTSIRTVRSHIRNVLQKLDVNSQGAATAIAREGHLQAPPIAPALWRRFRGGR